VPSVVISTPMGMPLIDLRRRTTQEIGQAPYVHLNTKSVLLFEPWTASPPSPPSLFKDGPARRH
jgi:hypothetical protein